MSYSYIPVRAGPNTQPNMNPHLSGSQRKASLPNIGDLHIEFSAFALGENAVVSSINRGGLTFGRERCY